jgi:phosphoserine phosphatase RsbX
MTSPIVLSRELQVIEWGVAARPMPGQSVCGDAHTVVSTAAGATVAVADGLGHGNDAALAAEIAIETIRDIAELPLASIITRCHEALRHTRGVALSMASFDRTEQTMSWVGIGNVDGSLLRASSELRQNHEALLLQGGVVGYSLPRPRVAMLPIAPGDTLVLATDGIRSGFKRELADGLAPASLAAELLHRHARDTDDALVLVVRYTGSS